MLKSRRSRTSLLMVGVLGAASGALPAQQLPLPAAGQPPFAGSAWCADDRTYVAVDLNDDGHPDLVRVAQGIETGLETALNNGHGVFVQVGKAALPGVADALAAGDLDGDGDPDFVTSRKGSSTGVIYTLTTDGVGHVTLVQSQPIKLATSHALGDFDLDGRLDVVSGYSTTDHTFQTLRGLGDGSLEAPVFFGTSFPVAFVRALDWDEDGDCDVLGCATANEIRLYFGDGAGHFSPPQSTSLSGGGALSAADMDVDGRIDAVNGYASGSTHRVALRRNLGPAFAAPVIVNVTANSAIGTELAPGDGFPDIVAAGPGTATLVTNVGGVLAVGASAPVAIAAESKLMSADVADFDGDGRADLEANGALFFQAANGSFASATHFALPVGSQYVPNVLLADLDGDGRVELIANDRDAETLLVRKGQAPAVGSLVPFGPWTSQPSGNNGTSLHLADETGDGVLDVVGVKTGTMLIVHPGQANATFGSAIESAVSTNVGETELGDFDGDGVADVLMASNGNQQVPTLRILHATGAGTFTALGTTTVNGNYWDLDLGDFDGDGNLDAVRAASPVPDGELQVRYGDGAGNLGPATVTATPAGVWWDMTVADFDADGLSDVAANCRTGGGVALYRNDGAGGFEAPSVGGYELRTMTGLIAADVDDDGALDLAYQGFFDSAIYFVRGDGHGGLLESTSHPGAFGGGYRSMAAADLDLDGKTDLLQAGTAGDEMAIFFRVGSAVNAWASIGGGVAGAAGQPRASGSGEPVAGQVITLDVDRAAPGALSFFVLGFELLDQPFKGAHLVPTPDLVLATGFTSAAGKLHMPQTWPADAPTGLELWMQVFLVDPAAAHGLAATGGLRLRVP